MRQRKIDIARNLIHIQNEMTSRFSSFITEEAMRRDGLDIEGVDKLYEQLSSVMREQFGHLKRRIELEESQEKAKEE